MSWRTITAGALVAIAAAPAAFALGNCGPNVTLAQVFPLVMCPEATNANATNIGLRLPWQNGAFAFIDNRNQFLFPSATVTATSARAVTIESIHTRASSFAGSTTYNFTGAAPQWIRVKETGVSSLVPTFALNDTLGPVHLNWTGNKQMASASASAFGGGGTLLSDFVTRNANISVRNDLDTKFDFRVQDPTKTNILVDELVRIATTGNSGFPVWDIANRAAGGSCAAEELAFGGSSFSGPNILTTAIRIYDYGFVWVFRGLASPPPANMQMQIAEIVRLLLTPESLRCTWLDLTPNGKVDDNAISFPDGKNYDPISPLVTSGGIATGEENGDGRGRAQGWN
jgi:hypothetical protein